MNSLAVLVVKISLNICVLFSAENNIEKSLPTFLKFCLTTQALGLDGFVFELPGECGKDEKVGA